MEEMHEYYLFLSLHKQFGSYWLSISMACGLFWLLVKWCSLQPWTKETQRGSRLAIELASTFRNELGSSTILETWVSAAHTDDTMLPTPAVPWLFAGNLLSRRHFFLSLALQCWLSHCSMQCLWRHTSLHTVLPFIIMSWVLIRASQL